MYNSIRNFFRELARFAGEMPLAKGAAVWVKDPALKDEAVFFKGTVVSDDGKQARPPPATMKAAEPGGCGHTLSSPRPDRGDRTAAALHPRHCPLPAAAGDRQEGRGREHGRLEERQGQLECCLAGESPPNH